MLLRKRNKLMKKHKVRQAEEITNTITKIIIDNNNKFLEDISEDPKKFWKTIKAVNAREKLTENITLSPETLNIHYTNISTDPAYTQPNKKFTANCLLNGFVEQFEVNNALKRLKKTATGTDEIPAWFLKISADFINEPVTSFINRSLTNSRVPEAWKLATII